MTIIEPIPSSLLANIKKPFELKLIDFFIDETTFNTISNNLHTLTLTNCTFKITLYGLHKIFGKLPFVEKLIFEGSIIFDPNGLRISKSREIKIPEINDFKDCGMKSLTRFKYNKIDWYTN